MYFQGFDLILRYSSPTDPDSSCALYKMRSVSRLIRSLKISLVDLEELDLHQTNSISFVKRE